MMDFTRGFDEEDVKTEETKEEIPAPAKKRAPFAYWTVGGQEYRLKLTTAVICQLEDKFRCNLMSLISNANGLPPLAVMLNMVHAGMKTWKSGIKYVDVQNMFDKYCEEGGTQLTFMTDVIMPLLSVSGFFSENQQASMEQMLEEVKEEL